ncbi:MAG TPA: ribbon-helix-helix protein, CopG family [Leptospiraceae bacterium]|jgi:hypothetical protein|nr:ribbon-helix-helix protein, CopG family [Leptospirales bacterium]HMU85625.1 ribbon-helix-helix protein, CopG family [Leptospiraceae bacterium]HMW61052.1 ribbon-helix-helix protein, CopG family [Leptospiraceae bacterium]HMX55397.1 ribbon-helix-helix protein, CopG family [Leptospiraceae bacterium]HMZ36889.1 ribbon-helix-helix protein, CopG family [Leptospiraceae bacterium]
MAELTRRLQILLDPDQMESLQAIAQKRRKSVAELIREAVDIQYRPRTEVRRIQAIESLRSFSSIHISTDDLK